MLSVCCSPTIRRDGRKRSIAAIAVVRLVHCVAQSGSISPLRRLGRARRLALPPGLVQGSAAYAANRWHPDFAGVGRPGELAVNELDPIGDAWGPSTAPRGWRAARGAPTRVVVV